MKNKRSEKIRVLLVAPSMRVVGGQSIQARRLLDAFAADEEVELAFVPNNPETIFEPVKGLRTVFASFKFWRALAGGVGRADVVHVFSSGTTSYLISTLPALLAAGIFRRKTILHYHTGEAETHLAEWKRTARPTMKKFDEIVVPSGFLADVFARFDLRARTIFNFVEPEKFRFRRRDPLKPVFLSNRNFEAHYQVADVLRAFRLIRDRFPEARLLVAGSGSEEASLKKLAADLKLENTEFLGKIENEKMPQVYDRADVYLNASVVDNMPLSIIEAFSCGLPVVTTDAGGIPYICEDGETALLVEKKDHEALARAAVRLFEDRALAQKIVRAARLECEKYSPENVRRQWLEIYRKTRRSV